MSSHRDLANALRFLSMDAVQKAKSGHPGMPMGMADIAQVLWGDYLRHSPENPNWWNRDRFVLSNGHGSMLLYALLHLSGYDLTLEDLKQFRQLHSRTPGHPEVGITPGVEVTTGPLGQGLGCAVGMALAEQVLAQQFNKSGYEIIDHRTYCFVGDGCLMEGISHEVCSLAGTLGLNKLIVFWDDNGISIDGDVSGWWRDDTAQRFVSYGWNVVRDVDGHDAVAIARVIDGALREEKRPTLICCKTSIGYGAPNMVGQAATHGSPLGAEEITATRENLDWGHEPFAVPQEIYAGWNARERGKQLENVWDRLWSGYVQAYPELANELQRRLEKQLPDNWSQIMDQLLVATQEKMAKVATRKASQNLLDVLGENVPELIGGSADLSCSNLTTHKAVKEIVPGDVAGNYINYGVREFGMSVIMNGLALHGGLIPYGGTFLTFADYARNGIRMSAIMRLRVIYVFTHDSIGLGEDGPTHQPIEHLTMLRVTPNVSVWRPCDAAETVVAWRKAVERVNGPTCLALSRQVLPAYERDKQQLSLIERGGYVLREAIGELRAVIIATGSEVELACSAANLLGADGIGVRVVSMPSVDIFLQQDIDYQENVLPKNVVRVAVEAGARAFWYQFVGFAGKVIGIDCYGESAPDKEVYRALGVTDIAVMEAVKAALG